MKLIKFVHLPNKANYDTKGDILLYFYFSDNQTELTREIAKDTDEYNTLLREHGKPVSSRCNIIKVNENIYTDDNVATIASKIADVLSNIGEVTVTPVELSLFSVSHTSIDLKRVYDVLKTYCSTYTSDTDLDEGLPQWCFKIIKNYIRPVTTFKDTEPMERGVDTRFSYADIIDFLGDNGVFPIDNMISVDVEHLLSANVKQRNINSLLEIIATGNLHTDIYDERDVFDVLSKHTSSNFRGYLYENVASLDGAHIICNTINDALSVRDSLPVIHTLFPSFKNYESIAHIKDDIEKSILDNTLKKQIDLIKVVETNEAENKLQNFVQAYYNSNDESITKPRTYVERFQIVCNTDKGATIPVESIFKRLHVSEKYPIARLKMLQSAEKMYRIYSKNQSTDIHYTPGDIDGYIEKHETAKLPVSGTIMRNFWKHNSGPGKTISILCSIEEKNEKYVSIDIKDNGLIVVTSINDEIHISQDILEDTIIAYVNPVIDIVSNTISDRGYTLSNIKSLNNQSIQSVDCDLKIEYPVFDFKLSDCFIPSILFLKSKSSILGIYKRTSNIRQDDLTDYVIDWAEKNGINRQKIPTLLTTYFGISLQSSAELFREWIDKHDQEYGGGREHIIRQSSLTSITFNKTIMKGSTQQKYITTIQNCDLRYDGNIITDILNTFYALSLNKGDKDALVKLGGLCRDINSRKSSIPVQIEETGELDIDDTSDEDTDNESIDLEFGTPRESMPHRERDNGGIDIDDLLSDYSDEESDDGETDSEDDSTSGEHGDDGGVDESHTRAEAVTYSAKPEYTSPEETFFGGAKATPSTIDKRISLTNPNYFFSRLKSREPTMFLNKKEGKFDVYSRLCPHNIRRQPVILTDEEKENIDKNYPGSYNETFKYGSTPENQHWYICPRYWCMKTNTSMTEEDVQAGKCGGSNKIIPFNARHVPDDAFVYEFRSGEHAEFKERYPGFIDKSNHPDNIGVPCCFSTFTSKTQQRRRDEYLRQQGPPDKLDTIEETGRDAVEKELPKEAWKKRLFENYFIGPDKFPIEQGRWGFIPLSVQRVMGIDKNICFISRGDSKTTRKKCLLRQGIENHPTQSFIACISDVYTDIEHLAKLAEMGTSKISQSAPLPKTIKECKEHIASIVTLDDFIQYNNGNLVDVFMQKQHTRDFSREVDIESLKGTRAYSMYMSRGETGLHTLTMLYSAYQSFKEYLLQDEEPITHEFLWDIICTPHKDLFPNGINLVIFRMPYADVTDNVELICPSDSYSSILFSKNKPTLILLERDGIYEPIYVRREKGNKISRQKLFRLETDDDVLGNIDRFFTIVEQAQEKCMSKNSIPGIYTFEEPLSANDALKTIYGSITPDVHTDVITETAEPVAEDASEPIFEVDDEVVNEVIDEAVIEKPEISKAIVDSVVKVSQPDIETPIEYIPVMKRKRCPNGTRLNKRTGNCEPIVDVSGSQGVASTKRKRCPNGTRLNKTTGNCEPK